MESVTNRSEATEGHSPQRPPRGERFRRSFEAAPIGMALVAPDGRFLEVNPALCELLGRSSEELLSTGFQPLTHPDDLEADTALLERALAGEIEGYELEKRYLRPDGVVVWAELHVSLIRDERGEPVHFVSQVADITDRKQTEAELRAYGEELRRLALTDPLSGLAGPKTLELELERQVRELADADGSAEIALGLIELGPATRSVDESELHAALRRVGEYVRENVREGDLAARAGQQRLALLMPGTDEGEARGVLERLGWCFPDLDFDLWIAAGVATLPAHEASFELLVAGAEADLAASGPATRAERRTGSVRLPRPLAQRVRRLLAVARQRLGMDVAFLAARSGGTHAVRAIDGDRQSVGLEVGSELVEEAISLPPGGAAAAEQTTQICRLGPRIGSQLAVPVRLRDRTPYGSLCFAARTTGIELGERQLEIARFTAELIADAFAQHEIERSMRREDIADSGIRALLSALDARDHYTGEHSAEVVALAGHVARRLGLPAEKVVEVEQVALLHDVGKVGIPDSILQKQGRLSDVEWELMREHPAIGERIVAAVDALAPLAPAVRGEHERYDGHGYPDGLAGEQIPIASRITFACDAYHAMISDRPYRVAMSPERAREQLREGAGSQFDPTVVAVLLRVLDAEA